MEVAPGGGNVPHYHKTYDEHFKVLEGTLEVLVDKETHTLRPGQKAVAKKNVLHRFRTLARGGRARDRTRQRGAAPKDR